MDGVLRNPHRQEDGTIIICDGGSSSSKLPVNRFSLKNSCFNVESDPIASAMLPDRTFDERSMTSMFLKAKSGSSVPGAIAQCLATQFQETGVSFTIQKVGIAHVERHIFLNARAEVSQFTHAI